jgi:Predicted nucleotide-binding protein containing TIR-like domain
MNANILPTAFIGCSNTQKNIAESIQANLQDFFEVEIWNQGVFGLTKSNIGNLISSGKKFDFAILVLTPDDILMRYDEMKLVPRDNIILEIGFFIGLLGIDRVFLVCQKSDNLKLPSDLDGIMVATYEKPSRISLQGALGHACTLIKNAVAKILESEFGPSIGTPYDEWTDKLVRSTLKVVCRVFENPLPNLNAAKFRAFIFERKGNFLECTHFWAISKTKEAVGILKFPINEETSKQVAVVKAAINKETVAVKVERLIEVEDMEGSIADNLCFVLAAPIIGHNGEVWGTVDIDTSSDEGAMLLNTERAKASLFELGRHLFIALSSRKKNE